MKKLLLLITAVMLSLQVKSGTITVTSPNGGEVWAGCTTRSITWTSSSVSNYYNIDYSTDNGASWVSVASTLYITSGTYSWQVPNISSTSCLVRITDANSPTTFDVSNATFSLTAPLIVTSPNGGESWEGGTLKTITWVATGTTSYFDIFLSTDAGATWSTVVNNHYSTTGQYSWTLPNTPSTTCLIKVRDHTNTSCMVDQSDNLFTITPATPVITVTSPNTNLTRYVGNIYSITWTSSWVTSNALKIDYSIDNGSSWIPIATNTENDGSYSWTVPNTPSAQCLVKITDLGNPSTYDVSNTTFTITLPWITVTAPNGGENYGGCSSKTITWNHAGTSGAFRVQYSTDNGASWNTLTSSASSTSYTWSSVPSLSSTSCLVKVSDVGNSAYRDSSDAAFTIVPNTDIIITSPNGGEFWEAGTSKTISWVSAPTSYQYQVYYSVNSGANWSTITSSTYSTTYNWTVPNNPSSNCLIKVADYNNSCIFDQSNAQFTITPTPSITVTSPNTAITRYIGAASNISWTSQYLTSSFVTIEYTYDNGTTWNTISAITNNTGSYSWTTPNTPSAQCRVRISEYNNPAVYDESNVNFTIAPPWITLTTPNGGESWKGCTTQNITWSAAGTSGTYRIYYSLNNGLSWTSITTTTSTSYSWTAVVDSGSTQVLIKVADNSNLSTRDSSNAVFTILKNADIVITSPNGGESWEVGTGKTVTWVSEPSSSRWDVYYSLDAGTNWNQITSTTYSTSQSWTIPNNPTTNALVRVRDYYNSCIQDFSNAVFTIAPPTPTITVTSPNTAITRYIGAASNISWTSQYLTSSFVTIEYTYDNGTTWNTISAITNNTGSYSWTTPNTPSAQCRVRISEYNNPVVYDESNVNFTIAPPWITVTSPNGGETMTQCNSYNVTWNAAGTSGTYRLYYSLNNGNNWINIGTTTSTSYSWTLSSVLPSANCLLKVADNSNLAIIDSSNNVFTINQNTDIIITSPNGGEQWQAGSSKTITWVAAPTSSRFNVYYSTDGGSSWIAITTGTYSLTQAWTIPNSPGTNCLIKVEDYYNNCINDLSNSVFTITPGTPLLTAPNGGQTWYYASNYNITWTQPYFSGNFVTLSYSIDSGATWLPIISATNNTGSYSWQVPATFSNKCLVKVNEYNNPSVYDISDAVFTIAPALTISTPNGNNGSEEWRVCTQTTIHWTSGGCSGNYKIEYSVNNGSSWSTIVSSYNSPGTNNSYDWSIPNTPSTTCRVRVTDVSNNLKTDISDAVFTIKPCITVSAPNGGQSLPQASSYNITWLSDGASNYYNIDYTTNGGSTWTNIVYNQYITTGSYTWTVPSVVSSNCKIRVTDYINTCKTDMSDYTFSIGMPLPVISVTTPNGGENLNGCNAYNITWSSTNTSNIFNIDYSIDSGSTWNVITTNFNTLSGVFSWTVPNISSSNCLIRVKDANNPSISDVSNAVFSMNQSVTASITAGGPTSFCTGNSVILTSSSASGNLWYPGGQTTQSITVNTSGPYYVVVTNAGCSATSATVTVNVSPVPSAPVATSNSPVPLNGTLQLTASTIPGAIYTWSGPNAFSSLLQNPSVNNATPALNGVYSVYATVNGCSGPSGNTTVTVNPVSSAVNISGTIMSEQGSYVEGTKVVLSGDAVDSLQTGSNGQYLFNVTQGNSQVITPSKNNDVISYNGITTFDLVLMQRHILNTQLLATPYKIIAADVNGSGTVTNLDIILTKSLILQNITSFPGNKLWAFANSSYIFPNPQNPFPYESTRSYSSAADATDQNFIGMKLGDVNNSWDPSVAKPVSNQGIHLQAMGTIASQGQTIVVPVLVSNFNQVSGIQFSVQWDPSVITYAGTENAALDMNFGTVKVEQGMLSALWLTEELSGRSLADGSVIFELIFDVIGEAGTSTPVEINSSMIHTEVTGSTLELLQLTTGEGIVKVENPNAVNESTETSYTLYQNQPNPFDQQTCISFEIAEPGKVIIDIYDLYGNKVRSFEASYPAGISRLYWDGCNSSGNRISVGTYYYRMQAGAFIAVRKMVLFK